MRGRLDATVFASVFLGPVVSLEQELGSNWMAVDTAMGTEDASWGVYSQMT